MLRRTRRRRLLDLPDEILNACLGDLLPPSSAVRNAHFPLFPHPTDLCNLMLVSKLFFRLATPWVWRRLHGLYPDPSYTYKLILRWEHLLDNPLKASHIRVLSLNIPALSAPNMAYFLNGFRVVMRRLDKLQVLEFISAVRNAEIDDIYAKLLTKPLLHTLIVSYHPANRRSIAYPSLSRLRRLSIVGVPWPTDLLAAAHHLKALSISDLRRNEDDGPTSSAPWKTLAMPWKTLREFSIYEVGRWELFLENFLSWKRLSSDTSPLKEISITPKGGYITAGQFELLGVLGVQLSYLSLSRLDPHTVGDHLESIALAFPLLQDLHLTTIVDTWGWREELQTLVKSLVKLRRLKRLYWNFGDRDRDIDSERPRYRYRFPDIVLAVASKCPSPEHLVFCESDGSWVYCAIDRGRDGVYKGYYVDYTQERRSFTSSWTTDKFNRV